MTVKFYSYLNLENTKTREIAAHRMSWFYSYLNLENTKTEQAQSR